MFYFFILIVILFTESRKYSTSSNSPDEKPKRPSPPKRKPQTSAGPSWRITSSSSEPPQQDPHGNQAPTTQCQPETQETPHPSLPCPSGHLTPPEEEYKKAVRNKGVMVAEPESGFTDTSVSDICPDNSSTGDFARRSDSAPYPAVCNQQSRASRELPANVQAMDGPEGEGSTLPSTIPKIPKKCARFQGVSSISDGGATAGLQGASGGACVGSLCDSGLQQKRGEKSTSGCKRERNDGNSTGLITYELAGMW